MHFQIMSVTVLACLGLLASSPLATAVANSPDNKDYVVEIARGLSIDGAPNPADSSLLDYKIANQTKHKVVINLLALKDPLVEAVVSHPNSSTGSQFFSGRVPSHPPLVEKVVENKANIVVLEPTKVYSFSLPKDPLLKRISALGRGEKEEGQPIYKVRLKFEHLVAGFDGSMADPGLFAASFFSKPLVLKSE